ncbi:hypothetical protein ACLB9X_20255 [Streptomyces sp. 5K101]|uniref:hypothetical protein n=1 Tax=Streptomyces sp. 5K101 TaxID=3390037 RepID=UPI0039760E8C
MKLSPNTAPVEPGDLLIRLHNQFGAAVDVTGSQHGQASRWDCHGCGEQSEFPVLDSLFMTRAKANKHAATCRAAYHRLA